MVTQAAAAAALLTVRPGALGANRLVCCHCLQPCTSVQGRGR